MNFLVNHPRFMSLSCAVVFLLMAALGAWLRHRFTREQEHDQASLNIVTSASLTLLGLMIGFTFSMASTRYDQRKLFEEAETNAIGTEMVRADLLPAADAAKVKHLLTDYLEWRIRFYQSDYGRQLNRIDQKTTAMQAELWQAVQPAAHEAPNSITALAVSGMNDVLNSQSYTQFAWWNRIPTAAWGLMIILAVCANLLVGYATKPSRSGRLLLLVLPLLISVSFFLIADTDSPRGGIIRTAPRDLTSLAQTISQPRQAGFPALQR